MVSLSSMREKLLDGLDYQKIRECMILLHWTYCGSQSSPSVEELRETAGSMLDAVMKDPERNACCYTGGFQANKRTWGDDVVYEILFAVEEASSNRMW